MSYRIGSFNIGGKMPFSMTDVEAVAKVIEGQRIDIIAFQDIQARRDVVEQFCKTVCEELSNRFDYRYARGVNADRSFAFLWRKRNIALIEEPEIYDRYPTKDGWFIKRDPLLGRFRTENGYEIRLINTHLFFSNENQRIEECRRITGDVYDGIASTPPPPGTQVFTFALGDYNLSCVQCNTISGENFPDIVTVQDGSTTLNCAGNKDDGFTSSGLTSNSYDHFSYDTKKVGSALREEPTAINVPEKSYGGDYTEYFNTVSDHIPVVIEIY